MIPLADVKERIDRDINVLSPESVALENALGLVLAEPITASEAIPPFDNTAMDGFAVRSVDTAGATEDRPVSLAISGVIAAGSVASAPLRPGEAMRIMTGAPMPEGADSVVMVELTESDENTVRILASVDPGNHVRPAGDDLLPGDRVFEPGTRITPAHIGVLAGLGRDPIVCIRRPRVGVFSTGDELVVGDAKLAPGQIRDSNRPGMLALVAEAGFEPVDLGLLPDNHEVISKALNEAIGSCDVLLTTGGVSMGDFDFVKLVLTELGDFNWMQVAIRPAKPLAFGLIGATPVFGLPGNPVSSMVSFELFARPAIRKMMGRTDTDRPTVTATADDAFLRRRDGKTHFFRVQATRDDAGKWHARSAGRQGSHQLSAMAAANALAVVPNGEGVKAGSSVTLILLDL